MDQRTGDLIELALAGEFDVIVHGCNCFHTMGAGIAKVIRTRFPEAYEADRSTEYGARSKLGTISSARIERGGARFHVVNAYTQHHWKGPGIRAEYSAIKACFEAIACDFDGARIGYPLIGAGLARGDWAVIAPLIVGALAGQRHTLVILPT
ncbi:macro domain-containing protein [Frigidibacter sp. SD6-1]|uniref:macro domain-containing protein n=1 Tax=Frigidibacter sp. SD6-1 TaxID=3032581 RepID=UPI0024DFCCF0|nr:macro domain-containing protein [Frigidibacter sp. SD6-1]